MIEIVFTEREIFMLFIIIVLVILCISIFYYQDSILQECNKEILRLSRDCIFSL